MNEQQATQVKRARANGLELEWWDCVEGVFRKIYGFRQSTADGHENFDEFMNSQFIVTENGDFAVDFYDADPEEIFLVNRLCLFEDGRK